MTVWLKLLKDLNPMMLLFFEGINKIQEGSVVTVK